MPWKATKLVFCGIPLRRRTLYMVTLAGAIFCVPAISWALLSLVGPFARDQQIGFAVAAVLSLGVALNGCRLILKHKSILYREEARVIWPLAVVLLMGVTGFACAVDRVAMKRGALDIILPGILGGGLLVILLYRSFHLSSHPKRSDVIRGDSGRRRSRSGATATPTPAESVAGEAAEEDIDDDEGPPPPDASAS